MSASSSLNKTASKATFGQPAIDCRPLGRNCELSRFRKCPFRARFNRDAVPLAISLSNEILHRNRRPALPPVLRHIRVVRFQPVNTLKREWDKKKLRIPPLVSNFLGALNRRENNIQRASRKQRRPAYEGRRAREQPKSETVYRGYTLGSAAI